LSVITVLEAQMDKPDRTGKKEPASIVACDPAEQLACMQEAVASDIRSDPSVSGSKTVAGTSRVAVDSSDEQLVRMPVRQL
jgi:hypothetical protein